MSLGIAARAADPREAAREQEEVDRLARLMRRYCLERGWPDDPDLLNPEQLLEVCRVWCAVRGC